MLNALLSFPYRATLTLFLALLLSSTAYTQCCQYNLVMQDSYGDGWNDGYLEVFVNDTLIGKYAAGGWGSKETFEVCDNDMLRLQYTPGMYEEEYTYRIYHDDCDVSP